MKPTAVAGLNGVMEYRGVRYEFREHRGEWSTWAMIVDKIVTPERTYEGTGRLRAPTERALLKKIDRHLDNGGKIRDL